MLGEVVGSGPHRPDRAGLAVRSLDRAEDGQGRVPVVAPSPARFRSVATVGRRPGAMVPMTWDMGSPASSRSARAWASLPVTNAASSLHASGSPVMRLAEEAEVASGEGKEEAPVEEPVRAFTGGL